MNQNISRPFNENASRYSFILPSVGQMENILAPAALDRLEKRAREKNSNAYTVFIDMIQGRLQNFLHANGEDSHIERKYTMSVLEMDLWGYLNFSAKPATLERLNDYTDNLFKRLDLSDAAKKAGAKWQYKEGPVTSSFDLGI